MFLCVNLKSCLVKEVKVGTVQNNSGRSSVQEGLNKLSPPVGKSITAEAGLDEVMINGSNGPISFFSRFRSLNRVKLGLSWSVDAFLRSSFNIVAIN